MGIREIFKRKECRGARSGCGKKKEREMVTFLVAVFFLLA